MSTVTVEPAEFFVAGGTLRRDAPSYVRRQADDELLQSLRKGQFCYILTARQMGKSSLMVRTAAQLREEGAAVALLDLTRVGQSLTAEQWYYGLLLDLGAQVGKRDECRAFWQANKDLGVLQRFFEAIRTAVLLAGDPIQNQLVVFIDEIDVVRSLPFSTDEFFAGIRDCHNRRSEAREMSSLTFCLLGVAAPSDLIRDTRLTPFNIGKRIELKDFTSAEAAPLAVGFASKGSLTNSAKVLERILYWTGGHPYLTQRLCQAVMEANPKSEIRNPKSVDTICADLYLSARARERDDNLLFVRERMLRSFDDLAALLEKYRDVLQGRHVEDAEADPLVTLLRLAGIVKNEGGRLVVRNRIYARVFDREWVRSSMPGAEVRRQKIAYRRGRRSTVLGLVGVFVALQLGLLGYDMYRMKGVSLDTRTQSIVDQGSVLYVFGERIRGWRFSAQGTFTGDTLGDLPVLSAEDDSPYLGGMGPPIDAVRLQLPADVFGSIRIHGRVVAPLSLLSRFLGSVASPAVIVLPRSWSDDSQSPTPRRRYFAARVSQETLRGSTVFAVCAGEWQTPYTPLLYLKSRALAYTVRERLDSVIPFDREWALRLYAVPDGKGVLIIRYGRLTIISIDRERARLNGGTPKQVAQQFIRTAKKIVASVKP